MVTQTKTEGQSELLARLRERRNLPPSAERRRIRLAARCSLRDVGEAVGVSQMAVVRWEQGSQPRNPIHVAAYGSLLRELSRLAP